MIVGYAKPTYHLEWRDGVLHQQWETESRSIEMVGGRELEVIRCEYEWRPVPTLDRGAPNSGVP